MNRRRLVLLSALAVVLVAAGVVVVVANRPEAAPALAAASPSPAAVRPTALASSQPSASDGGQLRVVEQGFTQLHESVELTLTPGYGPGHPEQYMPVRLGIIVENTSRTEAAINATFIARYLDPAGKGVVEYAAKTDENTLIAGVIYPGERVGIAAYFNNSDNTVAQVSIRAVGASWLTPSVAKLVLPRITATNVRTIHTGSPKATVVAFSVNNESSGMVGAVANAIYRDKSGTIIGSSHILSLDKQYFPSGTADGSITITDWLPANLDESRTQIFLQHA